MSAPPLLTLAGVHTHIGAYHILHGVDFEVPAGEVTMLLGRNGAGKTTTLRTIMGLWAASQGSVVFDGKQIGGPAATPRRRRAGAAADAGDRRAGNRLRAREHGHLRRPQRRREHAARGALGAPPRPARQRAPRVAVRPVPGAEEVLAPSRRQALGRAEADARDRPRDGRAAPAAADRRAEQGPRAGDRPQPDRRAARPQAHRDDGAARRAELPGRARRSATASR